MTLAQILSSGLLKDNPARLEERPELFKKSCEMVCPSFEINDANRGLMNDIYKYIERREGRLNPSKGLWLWGPIGTGKSTIIQIMNMYDKLANGLSMGGYPIGGFMIELASTVATKFAAKGSDGLEPYTYNYGNVRTISFDELGREPLPAKHFGTELNVMQYVFQCRYEFRSEAHTHVTTNLTLNEVQKKYGDHIADRINEMFNVIEVRGRSRR